MKKILTLVAASVLAFTSCTSDKNENDNQSSTSSFLPKTVSYVDPEDASNNSVTTLTYDGNKIIKIDDSDYSTVYSYTGDLITKTVSTEGYDGNVNTYTTVYAYNSDNNLSSEVSTSSYTSDSNSYKNKYTYTYNSNGTVLRSNYYYDEEGQEVLSGNTALLTVSGGNVLKKVSSYNDEIEDTETYKYDTSNSFFKNVLGMDKLYISIDGDSATNNLIEYTSSKYPQDNYTSKYTYNEQGFPTELKEYYGDVLDGTYKVAY